MGMPDCVYDGLKYVNWERFQCRIPNSSTSIFDTTILGTPNSFSQLRNDAFSPESDISFSYPTAISSPIRTVSQCRRKIHAEEQISQMRIVVLNCQSVKTSSKPAQLMNLITSLQADIVTGSESWLNPGIKSSEVFPDSFSRYRRDRPGAVGGVVFLLVFKQYDSSESEELKVGDSIDCELVWAKVKVLYIVSLYRPPDKASPVYLQHLQTILSRIPTSNGAHLWNGGDFNLPDIRKVLTYATYGTVSQQLLTKDAYLDQMVTQPTRIRETTANTLELFFSNNSTLINKVEIIPGMSDHEAVFLESSLRPMKVKTLPRKVYQYQKADYEGLKKDLKAYQQEFEEEAESEDVEHLWSILKKKIQSLMDEYSPSKMLRGYKTQKPCVKGRSRD